MSACGLSQALEAVFGGMTVSMLALSDLPLLTARELSENCRESRRPAGGGGRRLAF